MVYNEDYNIQIFIIVFNIYILRIQSISWILAK